MSDCRSNFAKLHDEIQNLKEQHNNGLTTRCYQLKMIRTTDDDSAEVIRNFEERKILQQVLNKLKLIEKRWRTLHLWEIVQSVNSSHIMTIGREELFKHDSTLPENKEDMALRWSIVLCCIFDDLMRNFSWKVGDTLDIEEDICDVVGKLILKIE